MRRRAGLAAASPLQDWRFLLGLFCVETLIEVTAWGHMVAFTPLFLARELGLDPDAVTFWTGVLAAMPLFLAVPLAPFWGVFSDRYSRKLMIIRSLAFEAVGYVVIALSHSLVALILVRLLLGLTYGNNALIVAALSLVVPDRRLGTAVGLVMMMFPIGLSTGPLLGSALIALLGLRGMFAMDAALCMVAVLALLFGFREPPRAAREALPAIRAQLGTVFATVQRVPSIRWNFAVWFLVGGGAAVLDPFIPVLIGHVYSGPALAATIGLLLGIYGVASGLFTPLVPRLADRIGEPRTLALASLVLCLVAFALPLSGGVALLALLLLVRAAPQAATTTALYTHLARHVPRDQRGGVMALSPLPRNIAMLLMPILASALSAFGLGAAFVLAGLLFLGSLGCALLLERSERPLALTTPRPSDA